MLTIAAVDDEPEFLSELTDALHKLTEHMEETRITAFSDSTAFLQANEPFDLIFMDIDMPVINGMEVAALLRERNSNAALIFISSYEHFVFESIRYMPFRFIRKSLYQEEVPEALQSWFALQSNQKQSITLRTGTGNANTFLLSEVIGFYAVRHDIYVLKQPHDSIQLYGRDMTMEKLEELTADTGFLRPHKSWLVNFRYIHQIFREEIILKSGDHIPLSRRRTNEIRLQYSKLLRERDRI
ncbi:MAG: response regulator transcription factor [Oscillospiraceae bacterium]|nr:response regulator transcription factor [Oscillospiraceae bacterium]